jgi:hypothetical protein
MRSRFQRLSTLQKLGAVIFGLDPLRSAKREAAEQTLGKQAKVQTALEANFAKHFQTIARDEEAAVRQYRNQTVFGAAKQPPQGARGDSDLVLCDDMNINVQAPSSGLGNIGTALGAAALGAAGMWYAGSKPTAPVATPTPQAPAVVDTDTNTQVTIKPLPGE